MLEVLSYYAMQFRPDERREAVRHLFEVMKGLLDGVDGDMLDSLLSKVMGSDMYSSRSGTI